MRSARRWWNRVVFVLVFATGAVLWSLAAARGVGESPIMALPYGVAQMTVAGSLAVVVWWMTGVVPWQTRAVRFFAANGAAIVLFAVAYTAAQAVPLVGQRSLLECLRAPFDAAVAGWNLLMGGWLYLAVAGVCYSRRADAALRDGERAHVEARVLVRDAQLAALNAQLQPHFLFNALHTVGALVHVDPDRADRALDELGKLLRYALRPAGEVVSLGEEWAFTNDYLAFESLRLGDRLRLEVSVDDRALAVVVPPFILQPLVENAVRHGVADSPGGGDVGIQLALDEDTVRLVVRNTSNTPSPSRSGMGGTSLRRLKERLALTYGPDRASVATRTGAEFEVTVTLPAGPE